MFSRLNIDLAQGSGNQSFQNHFLSQPHLLILWVLIHMVHISQPAVRHTFSHWGCCKMAKFGFLSSRNDKCSSIKCCELQCWERRKTEFQFPSISQEWRTLPGHLASCGDGPTETSKHSQTQEISCATYMYINFMTIDYDCWINYSIYCYVTPFIYNFV